MGIKVGNAPVSWGVMEVEGWKGQRSFQTVLDEIRQSGYQGTELGPYGFLPVEPASLNQELKSRELQMVTAFVPVPLARPERHEAAFREALKIANLLARIGAHFINLADVMTPERLATAGRVMGDRDSLSQSQWKDAAAILTRIAEACRALGLATTFHHHAGTFVETPGEIARLCAETDARLIGVCLDTGHYYYGGGDPVQAVQSYGSRIWHVHLKDVNPAVLEAVRREKIGYLEAVSRNVFCELGTGAVDFPKIIGGLLNAGFSGWAIVEQDVDTTHPDVQPMESALRSRRYLQQAVGI